MNYRIYCTRAILAGDINQDGEVGINDLSILGMHYYQKESDPDWDWRCNLDISRDPSSAEQVIDIFDLSILGKWWGIQK